MKKQFISYVVISSVILSSLLIAYFVTDSNRNDWSINNPNLLEEFDYDFAQSDIMDFQERKIADLSFNNSHEMFEIKSIDYADNFAGGYLTVGSIENGTDHKHGLIQLIEFDDTIVLTPEPYISSIYLNSTIEETEYLMCKSINVSYDSSIESSTVFALKEVTTKNTFDIDILEIDSGNLSLNTTIVLDDSLISSVEEFVVFDTNDDDFYEIYVLGENTTNTDKQILIEVEFNQTSKQYELSEFLEWDANDLEITAMEYIVESTTISFIISGMNSTSIETYLMAISLERNDIRNFTFESIIHIDLGTIIFRTYDMKLFNNNESIIPRIALFGTYIIDGMNYPSFVKISYQSGAFGSPEVVREMHFGGWSLTGLITDIDGDYNDEIILTTSNLVDLELSMCYLYTNDNSNQISYSFTQTYRMRSCDDLNLGYASIGSWLGFNSAGDEHYLEFYLSQYIPISLSANSFFLTEKANNKLQIDILNLHSETYSRNGFTMQVYLESHLEINASTSVFPSQIALNLSDLGEDIQEDDIIVEIYRNGLLYCQHSFTKSITTELEFEVLFPPNPFILRREADATQNLLLTIENTAAVDIGGNVTLETETSESNEMHYYYLFPQQKIQIDLTLNLIFSEREDYTEQITITLQTYAGTFQFSSTVDVKNSVSVLPGDLLNSFWIVLSIVVVFFFGFLFLIYRVNKESIRKHIASDEPLKMALPWFKSKAIDSLAKEYTVAGNWELGIKLTKEYLPEKLVQFHEYRARALLLEGQNLAWEGKFFDTLTNWEQARDSLVELKNEQWMDIINWLLDPLTRVVDARKMKNKEKKAAALLNEFQLLNGLSVQSRRILGVELTIPLYFVAEDLGLAYRDTEDLQNSLTYLQYAYQYAPDFYKNRIIEQITHLIGLGVQPKEMDVLSGQEGMEERLARRTIRCYSCGMEKAHGQEKCPHCGIDTVQCSVCKLPISFGVDTAECPHCGNISHKEHLQEWIKVKGTCPVCQRNLKADDIKTSISTE